MVFAEGPKGGEGRLNHGEVVGAEDGVEDFEDVGGDEGCIFVQLFDQSRKDLESDLNISAGQVSDVSKRVAS